MKITLTYSKILLLTLLAGCANIQDNTTNTDKLIIGSSLLVFALFTQGAGN